VWGAGRGKGGGSSRRRRGREGGNSRCKRAGGCPRGPVILRDPLPEGRNAARHSRRSTWPAAAAPSPARPRPDPKWSCRARLRARPSSPLPLSSSSTSALHASPPPPGVPPARATWPPPASGRRTALLRPEDAAGLAALPPLCTAEAPCGVGGPLAATGVPAERRAGEGVPPLRGGMACEGRISENLENAELGEPVTSEAFRSSSGAGLVAWGVDVWDCDCDPLMASRSRFSATRVEGCCFSARGVKDAADFSSQG
jgi:hypothetical protein